MRAILSMPVSLALSMAVSVLTGLPASAIGIKPVAAPAVLSAIAKVSARCHIWEHRCRGLYPGGGWRYRRCMALHGCRG